MAITLNGTTGITDVNGTAAAPAITGTDTDTGLWFPAADTVAASTAGAERLRIDSSGNVGIGTSSGTRKLNVYGGATSTRTMTVTSNASEGLEVGVNASNIATVNSAAGGAIIFTQADTERMRIDSSGYLLVGYTSSNGAYKLQVNSQIFATNATISTSDGRYKENIQTLDGALSLVSQLNPVQFSWKEHPVHNFDRSGPTIGFIAQEVEQVLVDKPYLNSIIKLNECVIEPEEKDAEGNITKEAVTEEFLGIAEGNMIALLTKAIQEQQALITSLTDRIAALEAR